MTSIQGRKASEIGDAVAEAVAASVSIDRDAKLSVKQMKQGLRASLAESGVLKTIKSQLRREFIANMKEKANGAPSSYERSADAMNLQSRISFSSIYHLLKQRGMQHSLAVFTAESGLDSKNAVLSETDIVRAMNLQKDSPVLQAIAADFQSEGTRYIVSGVDATCKENDANSNNGSNKRDSILDLMIEHSFRAQIKNTSEMCVQTDAAAMNPRQTLDSTIMQLRNTFESKLATQAATPIKSLEERMLQYQKECDDRLKRDVELQMKLFRDNEIMKLRIQANDKARMELQAQRVELESEFMRRTKITQNHEEEILRSNAERDKRHQMDMYTLRQKMQKEIEETRARELSNGRRFEIEQQGLKMLELQLNDIKQVLDGRERELATRERECEQRMRNASESAREEARNELREELASATRDRKHLMHERQRVADEKTAHETSLESLSTYRKQVKDLQIALFSKEEEYKKVDTALAKLQAVINGEVSEGDGDKSEMLRVLQRNAELEAKLPGLIEQSDSAKDAVAAKDRAEGVSIAQKAEISKLGALLENAERETQQLRERLTDHKAAAESEKVKLIAITLKNKELERLLAEKRKIISSLTNGKEESYSVAGGDRGSSYASARSFRDIQKDFALKRAEDFADALISSRRASQSQTFPPAAPVPATPTSGPHSSHTSTYQYRVQSSTHPGVVTQPQRTAEARQEREQQAEAEAAAWEAEKAKRGGAVLTVVPSDTPAHRALAEERLRMEQEKQELERLKAALQNPPPQVSKVSIVAAPEIASSMNDAIANPSSSLAALMAAQAEEEEETCALEAQQTKDAEQTKATAAAAQQQATIDMLVQQQAALALQSQQMEEDRRAHDLRILEQQKQDEERHQARLKELAAMESNRAAADAQARLVLAANNAHTSPAKSPVHDGPNLVQPHAADSASESIKVQYHDPVNISSISATNSSMQEPTGDTSIHSSLLSQHDNSQFTSTSTANAHQSYGSSTSSSPYDNVAATGGSPSHSNIPVPTPASSVQKSPEKQAGSGSVAASSPGDAHALKAEVAEETEEEKRAREDAARIAEARAKVLARRKGKAQRDKDESQSIKIPSHSAGPSSVPAAGRAEDSGWGSRTNNSQINNDSDVEITMGQNSDEYDSAGDSSWF